MAPTDDDLLDTFTSGVTGQFVDDARADAVRAGDGRTDAGTDQSADAGTQNTISAAKAKIDSPMYGSADSSRIPLAFARDQNLQKLLDDAISKNKQYANLRIALVDLTAAGPGERGRYAEHQGDASISLDSIAKLAPMYAAYQLRHDLNAFAAIAGPKDASALQTGFVDLLRSANDASVRAAARKPPKLDAVFELEVQTLSRGVGFSSGFGNVLLGGDLRDMIQWSDDRASSRCIAYLGFEWINALLRQSGLASMSAAPEPNGFYLGRLYSALDTESDPYLKKYPYFWPGHRTTETQYGSAQAVAQLLTLLATDQLVDKRSSGEMRDLLLDQNSLSFFGNALDTLLGSRAPRLQAKVGYLPKENRAGDCAIVSRLTTDKHRIRYVAVGLGAKFESNNRNSALESLIKDLDACVLTRNGLKD